MLLVRSCGRGLINVAAAAQCFAPQLIVLRVMSGRAWTRDVSSMLDSRLEFTERSTTQVEAALGEKMRTHGTTSKSSSELVAEV